MDNHSIRILVVDDHALIREGLIEYLRRQPDMQVVAEAANGREGIESFHEHRPDLVLTDDCMPVMDGIKMTAILLLSAPEARVIILREVDEVFRQTWPLPVGAKAFWSKDAPLLELMTKIRQVYQAN